MAKKHVIDAEDKFWIEVLKFKLDNGYKNNNEAVLALLKIALEQVKK